MKLLANSLKHTLTKQLKKIAFIGVSFFSLSVSSQQAEDYDAIPPSLAENSPPLIMLALSVDHQLFYKAYTDFEDINDDGILDTGYTHDIDYAGYFDSYLCYEYNSAQKRYEPSSITQDKYCEVVNGNNSEWSGNFLNWATMTRIDEVRLILYGGLRSTDTDSETILERSYLPNDAHSFPKYYNGPDLLKLTPFGNLDAGNDDEDDGITICNTTRYTGNSDSESVNSPPLARVVDGNYSLWSANERWQCLYSQEQSRSNGNDPSKTGIYAHSSNPSTAKKATQQNGSTIGDYVVRVVSCDSNFANNDYSNIDCKQYPDGNFKPIGLLQEYGEDSSAVWGLMSGSYTSNKDGGVLRKDIGSMDDEINIDTDGTFKNTPASGGIIAAVSALRIANYSVRDGGLYNNSDNCRWERNYFNNGSCTNWGNPFAEILLECYRYYANKQNPGFNANDVNIFADLKSDSSWNNPQTEETACAELNVIAFNASSVSYDSDSLGGTSDLFPGGGAVDSQTLTKVVGDGEGISGNQYFVGESGASTDQLCTAKTVNDLGLVRGTCPDSPRLSGSYHSAGLAHHARITDLRSDLSGEQSVVTYGVTLATGVPNVNIAVPGSSKTISILPACHNSFVQGNCGLVDFKIVEQETTTSKATGTFYVNWEDSEQGGDYDQDMSGVLKYELTATRLKITTEVIDESAGSQMAFGYVLSGTTDDGFQAHSGINGYTGSNCSNCRRSNGADTETYNIGSSTATLLELPLYYAAKWGGFDDINGNDIPDLDSEWDADGDGVPDSYVSAIDPLKLKEQLGSLVVKILERTASGTAAAVNAQTGSGEGAIYQALYTPRIKESGSDLVTWVGSLRSFFLDKYARTREDTNGNATLDDTDYVVDFEYDTDAKETYIVTYEPGTNGVTGAETGTPYEISDYSQAKPIWDAQAELSSLTNITANRTYSASANTGRYIFTSFDRGGLDINGNFDPSLLDSNVIAPSHAENNSGQTANTDMSHAFVASNFQLSGTTANDFRYLGFDSTATQDDVDNLVNYIRGDESIPNYRNRTLGSDKLILGDIIHSTPSIVARPDSNFDLIYRDESYQEFREYYENRRSVIYVGANDGMLHAFNGGFFDSQTSSFKTSLTTETAHPLGAELWAYVPHNLLPHLQWLTNSDYPHVYYVDGPTHVFDVNIFPPSTKHTNGWGTILVVGMRFGGGEYELDVDGNGNIDKSSKSAFIVMDITDPEEAPELIAEIAVDGFATAQPSVVKYRKRNSSGTYDSNSENSWYLVLGSGPAGSTDAERASALDDAISYASPTIKVFDLNNKTLTGFTVLDESGSPETNGFVGGFEVMDWDLDYDDDAAYYGLISGDAATPGGKLKRATLRYTNGALDIDDGLLSNDLYNDSSLAFSATPTAVRDSNDEWWVFAGTGRFMVPDDNLSNQQQYYFGIKEPYDLNGDRPLTEPVDDYDLQDTTKIDVYEDGRVREDQSSYVTLSAGGETQTLGDLGNFDDVNEFIKDVGGWRFSFETPPSTLNPRIRNTTKAAIAGESLVISAYQATNEVCNVTGTPFLYSPHLETGIPAPYAALGTNSNYTLTAQNAGDSNPELVISGSRPPQDGTGMPSDPVILPKSTDECDTYVVLVQTTTGEINDTVLGCEGVPSGRQSWREIPLTW